MNSLDTDYLNIDENKLVKIKKSHFYSIYTVVVLYMVLAFSFLTSCSKDDAPTQDQEIFEEPQDVLPTISLTSGTEEQTNGVIGAPSAGSLQHKVTAKAPDGFDKLIISKVVDGVETEYQTIDKTHPNYVANSNTFTYDLGYIFTDTDANKAFHFTAKIIDANNNAKTLKFAEAIVKKPMAKSSFVLQTTTNDSYHASKSYYLFIKENAIIPYIGSQATKEENDNYIAAILSYNNESGLYLASATNTDEIYLTDNLLEISRTKFKYDKFSENKLHEDFNIYDVYNIENNFASLLFAEKEERIDNLKEGARFYFRTHDDHIAIVQVVRITSENMVTKQINFDIFVTQ